VTQVSQRTRIRETIIRGIERGDYSACGGDFYARGHIRSIARAVDVDPEPLIREYDVTQGAPQAISAAEVFQTSAPIRLKERRRPNWSAAMALVLALIVGLVVWRVVAAHGSSKPPPASSNRVHNTGDTHPRSAATKPKTTITGSHPYRHKVVIDLVAAADCWTQLTTLSGRTIFSGMIYPGSSEHWTSHQTVYLVLGNPGGVTLTVNGKNAISQSAKGHVLREQYRPGQQINS
jgi:cytoskeletal protein RodZ